MMCFGEHIYIFVIFIGNLHVVRDSNKAKVGSR